MSDLEEKVRNYTRQLEELRSQSCKPSDSDNFEKQIEKLVNTVEKASTRFESYEETEVPIVDDACLSNFIDSNFKKLTTSTMVATEESKNDNQKTDPITTIVTYDKNTENSSNSNLKQRNDGVYVDKYINIKEENVQKITNRYKLSPADSIFLDDQSQLQIDPSFVRQTPPNIHYSYEIGDYMDDVPQYSVDEIHTSFSPAFFWDPTQVVVNDILRVEIKSIKYLVHRLSSDQFYYTKKLEALYREYQSHIDQSLLTYYNSHIKVLRKCLKTNPENKLNILSEIINYRELVDKEEQTIREYKDQLIVVWQQLQDIRTATYIETPVALKWLSHKLTDEEKVKAKENQEKNFRKRIKEILEYKYLSSGEQLDENGLYEDLIAHRKKLGLPFAGDIEWIPKLIQIDTTEESKIPDEEIERLKELSETYTYAKVIIGSQTAISIASSLDDDFTSTINFGCKFVITRIPKYVKIELWEQSSRGVFKVCDASLPVFNGEPAKYSEYHFTSDVPLNNGKLVEGEVLGAAFICTNPNASITRVRQNKPHQKAQLQVSLSGIPDRQRTYASTNTSIDPNDPMIIEALSFNPDPYDNKDRDMRRFKLDTAKNTTMLASMAPTNIFKNPIDIKGKKKKQNDKLPLDEIITEVHSETPISLFTRLWNFFFRKRRPLFTYDTEEMEEPNQLFIRISSIMHPPNRTSMCLVSEELNQKGYESDKSKKPKISLIALCGDKTFESGPMKIHSDRWDCEFEFDISEFDDFPNLNLTLNFFDNIKYKFPKLGNKSESHYIGQIDLPLLALRDNNWKVGGTYLVNCPLKSLANTIDKAMTVQLSVGVNKFSAMNNVEDNLQLDINGSPLCNFIFKMKHPETVKDVFSALRFVSMFATVPHSNGYIAGPEEFLDNCMGTSIEHSLCLSCFLLTLGFMPVIIIGTDIFEGNCSYVHIQHKGESVFLDACKNKRYKNFPFHLCKAVVTQDFVYLPLTDKFNFEFSDPLKWKVYGQAIRKPDIVDHEYIKCEADTNEIASSILKAINDMVKSNASRKISWSKTISSSLEKIIDTCESEIQNGQLPKDIELSCGDVPIRAIGAPFLNYFSETIDKLDDFIELICGTVANQHFYEMEGDNIVSALSIKVFPHTNGFHAVWVFLASIQKLVTD